MDRIIVDDKASAIYMTQIEQRLKNLEENGVALDGEGNVVSVAVDQVLNNGTEIGGITIGGNRTALYAPTVNVPEVETVTVTPLVESGVKIANITVGETMKSLYAPAASGEGAVVDVSGKLDKPSGNGTNGQVLTTDGQGGTFWSTVSSGDTIINGSGGDGPMPLLKTITLNEEVSTIVVTQDDSGNAINVTDAFYIEGELELANDHERAQAFNVTVGESGSNANVPIAGSHLLNTGKYTYIDVYAKQVAPRKWIVETCSKDTIYETPKALGLAVGELGYDCWNGLNNPTATVGRIMLNFGTNYIGRNSQIKIYGR